MSQLGLSLLSELLVDKQMYGQSLSLLAVCVGIVNAQRYCFFKECRCNATFYSVSAAE